MASLESEIRHTLVIVPHHRRVRLVGMHFDTNKAFLLPSAMRGIRAIRTMYDEVEGAEILVVGHTDRRGEPRYNELLSLERAEAIVAFMKDDVEEWNKWFSASALEKKWGGREVHAMLSVLPEGEPSFLSAADAIRRFQRWSNEKHGTSLLIDGVPGPETRRALIAAYMALDHTTLPASAKVVAHGCGPHHAPFCEGGELADEDLRRVDVFAFEGPVRPPPPGAISHAGSPVYPEWVLQMQSTVDVSAAPFEVVSIFLKDRDRQRMPHASYRIRHGAELRTGVADEEGRVVEAFNALSERCTVEWGEVPADIPPTAKVEFLYERELFLDIVSPETSPGVRELQNLAYFDGDHEERMAAFEDDYEVPRGSLAEVHREGRPAPKRFGERR